MAGTMDLVSPSVGEQLLKLHVMFKVLAVVFVTSLLRVIISQKKSRLFPSWAALEIALASYVIRRGGWTRQLQ